MTKNELNLFTWNDVVIINSNASDAYPKGEIAVICGMEQVESLNLSHEFNVKIGDWIYTIEFADGHSIEIPEIYLKKYESAF